LRLLRIEILIFVVCVVLLLYAESLRFLDIFFTLNVEPDGYLKPDGFRYGYQFLPVGTDIDIKFYLWTMCWWTGI
jgi:hypothetical protein